MHTPKAFLHTATVKKDTKAVSFFQFTDLYVSGGYEPFNSAFKQDLAVGSTDRAAADKRDGAVDEGENCEGKLLRIGDAALGGEGADGGKDGGVKAIDLTAFFLTKLVLTRHKDGTEIAVCKPEAEGGDGEVYHPFLGFIGKGGVDIFRHKLPAFTDICDDAEDKLLLILKVAVGGGAGDLRNLGNATERKITQSVLFKFKDSRTDKTVTHAHIFVHFYLSFMGKLTLFTYILTQRREKCNRFFEKY